MTDYFARPYQGATKRVEKVIEQVYPDLSYGLLSRLIDRRDVFVDGVRIRKETTVRAGQTLSLFVTPDAVRPKVVYQDDNILVLYKPKGVCSDGPYSFEGVARWVFGDVRLMHRLDTNTDGLLLFAENETAYQALYRAMKEGEICKYYTALVYGEMRPAVLHGFLVKDSERGLVRILDEERKGAVHVECEVVEAKPEKGATRVVLCLHGGKTHQLRAQLAHAGHFILGDGKYGDDRINRDMGYKKQQLTAFRLVFCMTDDPLGLRGLDIRLPDEA